MPTKTVKRKKTRIIPTEEAKNLQYPLPASLTRAAGMMKHKRKALERHLQTVRDEWDRHSH